MSAADLEIIATSNELELDVGYSSLRGAYWLREGPSVEARAIARPVVLCRATPSCENGVQLPSIAELIATPPGDAKNRFIISAIQRHNG
jgi:hypothetical protein